MSRSGYNEDGDYTEWSMICWRGAVASATRGRRGQALLKETLEALDKIESKRLVKNDLAKDGEFCTLGALGAARGIDMTQLDPEDYDSVANTFGVAGALAREIMYMNDDYRKETPEDRWVRMRIWVESQIKEVK